MKLRPLINQFNVGEVSPLIDSRTDVQKYYGACRRLENMIPLVQGGARKRPGSYYVAASKDGTRKSMMVPFQYSTIQAYMLEFGHQYIRFYKNRRQIIEAYTEWVGTDDFTSQYPSAHNDAHVKATSKYDTTTWPYYATDPAKLLTGSDTNNGWASQSGVYADQRFHIDLDTVQVITRIRIDNYHSGGSATDHGVKNFTIYGSNNAADFADLTYANDGTWVKLDASLSAVSQHKALDVADPQYITINNSVAYRYYCIKFSNNYAGAYYMGIRRVEFQTGEIVSYYEGELVTNGGSYYRCISAHAASSSFADDLAAGYWEETAGASDIAYEIATPFNEDELFEIDYSQSADILYLAHPNHKPMELIRSATSGHAWALGYRTFKYGDDRDITGISKAASAVVTSTAHGLEVGQWVKFSQIVGMTEMNGKYGKITAVTDNTFTVGINSTAYTTYTSGGVASLLEFKGKRKDITGSTATNPVVITSPVHGFHDGDLVWIDKVIGMTNLNNKVYTVENATDDTFELSGIDGSTYSAYTSGGYVTPTIFTADDDYPGVVGFFEQRIVYGGSNNQPHTFWLSESGAYDTFNITQTGDDVAIEYTLSSGRLDRIRWLVGQEYLMAGTEGGIWKIGSTSTGEALTQDNISAKRQTTEGAKDTIMPKLIGDSIIYVQTGGRTVRDLYYTINKPSTEGGYSAGNLTAMAEHIAKGATEALSGIIDMDYQQEPFSILWCVRADGQLLALVYDREQQLVGWSRMWTGDEDDWDVIESVAVINNGEMENEVWVSVKRTIGGTDYRYIEYFKPHEFFSEIKDCFFVDSGLTWDGGDPVAIIGITKSNPAVVTAPGHTFTDGMTVCIYDVEGMTEINIDETTCYTVANSNQGAGTFELSGKDSSAYTPYSSGGYVKEVTNTLTELSHLEGKAIAILIDGVTHNEETVSSGTVSLDWYGNLIHAGLPYTPYLQPMKPEAGMQGQTTQGMKGRIYHLHLSVYESYGVKVGKDASHLYDIKELNEDTPSLCTGYYDTAFDGNVGVDLDILITQEGPYPLTIRAIVPEMEKFP